MNGLGITNVSINCDPITRIEEMEGRESKDGRGGKRAEVRLP